MVSVKPGSGSCQGTPARLGDFKYAYGDSALSATHSVLGIEICLASDEVLCALVVTSPHRHVQRCAEQLKSSKTEKE